MKAAYIQQVGPPENIRYGELPVPPIGPSDILVRMIAVTVDPIDTYIRSGAYHVELPVPFIIGRDMTGEVQAVGSGVTRFRQGDRVWCNNQGYGGRQGTFAEFAAIHEDLLYHLPVGSDPLESVAVLHSALTATTGLCSRAKILAGESIFINGGSGNVGSAVIQVAKSLGARVAVTAGNEDKAQWCRQIGADRVIHYKTERLEDALAEFAPQGVDLYWDATGEPDVERALPLMAHRGRLVLMSGLKQRCTLPVGPFYTRNLTMYGFTVTDSTVEELAEHARQINALLAQRVLHAKVHSVLPLSQAAEAHRQMERGEIFGKIVLVPQR